MSKNSKYYAKLRKKVDTLRPARLIGDPTAAWAFIQGFVAVKPQFNNPPGPIADPSRLGGGGDYAGVKIDPGFLSHRIYLNMNLPFTMSVYGYILLLNKRGDELRIPWSMQNVPGGSGLEAPIKSKPGPSASNILTGINTLQIAPGSNGFDVRALTVHGSFVLCTWVIDPALGKTNAASGNSWGWFLGVASENRW